VERFSNRSALYFLRRRDRRGISNDAIDAEKEKKMAVVG
jgi:hypothetical protein